MRSHLIALVSCLTLAASAHAQVLKSNFGPGDAFNSGASYNINDAPNYQAVGVTFVPTLTASLSSIDLAVRHLGGTNSYLISLSIDSAGQPGALLESWTAAFPGVGSVVNLASIANPSLNTSNTYWLTIHPGVNDAFGGWFPNNQGELGLAGQFSAGGLWASFPAQVTPVYRINGGGGTAAPEPGTVALLGLGIAAAGVARRRRA